MALKKSQRSLRSWTEKAIKSLSAKEYAATTKKKREDTKKGKQFSKQPKKTARKVRKYRKVK